MNNKIILVLTIFILALASGFLIIPKAQAAYTYYRSITVTSTASVASGTQTNFPMLVSSTLVSFESTSSNASGRIQNLCTAPNGGQEPCDLIFTTSVPTQSGSGWSCGTSLNFETESYTSSTGALIDWVNVPTLSTGTTIYACYGNSSVTTDQSHPSSTWDSNYKGVWHLATPTSTLQGNDATANSNNGTVTGITATGTIIDGGGKFTGSPNYIDIPDSGNLEATSTITLESWINYTMTGGSGAAGVLTKDNAAVGKGYGLYLRYTVNQFLDFDIRIGTTWVNVTTYPNTAYNYGDWHQVVGTYNGSLAALYVDGTMVASTTASGAIATSSEPLMIGHWSGGNSASYFIGIADEFRVSTAVARSADWILTEYNNQSSPSTFYTMGDEITVAGVAGNTTGYAWGDKAGWVNFSAAYSDVVVTASSISGYAWSQNFGWINLGPAGSGVINDGKGNLSGYAWSQNAGYINFSGVTIDGAGIFHGTASGTYAGRIVFDSSGGCTYCSVATTWTASVSVTVSGVSVNGSSPIVLSPASTEPVSVSFTVTDSNGCSAVFTSGNVTTTLYRMGVGSSCAADNRNCYITSSQTNDCSGNTANATATLNLYYFADSTGDPSSSYPSDHWQAYVQARDGTTNATGTATSSVNDVNILTAITVTTSTINYGTMSPNSTTTLVNEPNAIVQNVGNSSTTLKISGTALALGLDIFAINSQHYATSSFTFGGSERMLSDTATTVSGVTLGIPTSTAAVTANTYWGVQIPGGATAGQHTGTITFSSQLAQ